MTHCFATIAQVNLSTGQIGVIAVVMVLVLLGSALLLLARQYKRCPSNRILVIYGKTSRGGAAKTIHGGAAFVVPLFQSYDFLSLDPIQIEIPLRGALSSENIRVNVPSVFTVAIGTEPAVMNQAAIRLLGLTNPEVRKQAEEIIFGQLRQVIASMGIKEINRDRDTFLQHVQQSLEPELNKVGLQLINVNITDITDESGYIDAIGQKAASQAIQQARGDVAEEEKTGETRVAAANRDRAIQVAEAEKEQQIGTRQAGRDKAIRVADMDKEQVVGEKTAAFQQEMEVTAAEREKRISVASANATAIDGENEAQARIAASQADLAIKKAEAFEAAESRQKEAEARVQEAQNLAMAEAALANAKRLEAEARAQLEAPAKAAKAKTIVEAEADAEKVRIQRRPTPTPFLLDSMPRHAANLKYSPKRVKVCNGSWRRVAVHERRFNCCCWSTSTNWRKPRPRPFRISNSTRLSCGRTEAITDARIRPISSREWQRPSRQ